MSENEKIYIQLEPKKQESGFSAIAMPILSVLCFGGAVSVVGLLVPAIILIVASIVFAWIGLFMCSRVRKNGGTMPYARTFATLGYIVCLCIIIASILSLACVAGVGGCMWSIFQGASAVLPV